MKETFVVTLVVDSVDGVDAAAIEGLIEVGAQGLDAEVRVVRVEPADDEVAP
jgi:hypothetical protein